MQCTTENLEQFSKTILQNCNRAEESQLEKIAIQVRDVKLKVPKIFEEEDIGPYLKERSKVLNDLVDKYFSTAMGSKFPELSPKLFEIKRYLRIDTSRGHNWITHDTQKKGANGNDHTKIIETPLYVYAPLNKDENVTIGKYTKRVYGYYGSGTRTIKISSTLPKIDQETADRAIEPFLQHYFSVLNDIFTRPILSDIIVKKYSHLLQKPELGILYVPKAKSMSIKTSDNFTEPEYPAETILVATVLDHKYLIQPLKTEQRKKETKDFFSKYLKGN